MSFFFNECFLFKMSVDGLGGLIVDELTGCLSKIIHINSKSRLQGEKPKNFNCYEPFLELPFSDSFLILEPKKKPT